MSGFEFVNMADYGLKDERYATDLFPYCSHEVIAMMKNMGFMLGMGLRKEGKGVVEFPNIKAQMIREGLGFFVLGHMWNLLEHMLCKLTNHLTKRTILIIR